MIVQPFPGVDMHGAIICTLLFLLLTTRVHSATIIVPDQHPSIQSAIDNAAEGDTVRVRNGRYHEHITLKDSIVLIGESILKTVIIGKKKSPVITAGNKSLIKNLTVTRGRSGILCENTELTIEHVYVTGNYETGIHCLVALPDIFNCVIYRNRGSGILCESTRSIKTSIMHNIIAENGYCGIMLNGTSEVLIQNNVLLGNRQFGIWGMEAARRTRIVYNLFSDNRTGVNVYLRKDPSNITENPGYPLVSGRYDFFSTSGIALKGRGKDGSTIGLIDSEILSQKLTDPDEDGVTGDNDKCPGIPEDSDGFEDSDGCPEFDNDNDGIFDTQDACPDSAEDFDGFRDEDGCPDTDNDADGIPDSIDVCKDNAEMINGYKDTDGCPDEVPPYFVPDAPDSTAPAADTAVTAEPPEVQPEIPSPSPKPEQPVKKAPADSVR
jgi:OOP family OmpA-OmpF porin